MEKSIDWSIIDDCIEPDWSGDPWMSMYQEQISDRCRKLEDHDSEWDYWEHRFQLLENYIWKGSLK